MSDRNLNQRIFRSILRSIGSEDHEKEDYSEALARLRSGEYVAVLEQLLSVLSGEAAAPSRAQQAKNETGAKLSKSVKKSNGSKPRTPDELFEDVKRRKVNRQKLESHLASINREFASQIAGGDTMREIINKFREEATDREWQLLTMIVNGNIEDDPYMRRIQRG
jgi:hypothetical protein